MATKHDFHKVIIGRSEVIVFFDLEEDHVPAKTDTGAYRSAVHASDIALNPDGSLSYNLLGGHPVCGSMSKVLTTDQFKKVWVANSFGRREERYEVKLKTKLGSKIFQGNFTLADRSKKIYPVLLGRKLLNHRFIVDSSETNLDRVTLKQRYGIDFPKDEEEGRDK